MSLTLTRLSAALAGTLTGLAVTGIAITGAAAQGTDVKFTLDWKFEGPAAPFLVGIDKGYFKAEGLNVTIDTGNGSRDTITRIAGGAYQMGFGDINTLIEFADDKADAGLKAVMMIYERPPFAVIGRKSLGVTTDPKSLEGKTLGAPQADGAFGQWPVFHKVAKLDISGIKLENVGFPVREPMLAQGKVQAIFGFSFSSVLNLKSQGVAADDISLILMAENGLDLYGNAILVSNEFAAKNPNAVKGFLKAMVKGMRDTAKDPGTAVEAVLKRNTVVTKPVELERLQMALAQNFVTPAVKKSGFGGIEADKLARNIAMQKEARNLKNPPAAGAVFDASFLPPAADRMIQ